MKAVRRVAPLASPIKWNFNQWGRGIPRWLLVEPIGLLRAVEPKPNFFDFAEFW